MTPTHLDESKPLWQFHLVENIIAEIFGMKGTGAVGTPSEN
jgi:hypothetical protein